MSLSLLDSATCGQVITAKSPFAERDADTWLAGCESLPSDLKFLHQFVECGAADSEFD